MDDDGPLLTIGQLSRRAGLPVRTIRFWSDIGVLPPAGRTGSGRRLYDAACLARLELIVTLRQLGLGRIKTLIGRLFRIGYTIEGVWKLLSRHGWSCQVPVRQAIERDEDAVVEGRGVARDKSAVRDLGAFICSEDEAGQGLRPPKGRTWARRGACPVVRVRTCSTSCACTAAVRARPRGSAGRTTGT